MYSAVYHMPDSHGLGHGTEEHVQYIVIGETYRQSFLQTLKLVKVSQLRMPEGLGRRKGRCAGRMMWKLSTPSVTESKKCWARLAAALWAQVCMKSIIRVFHRSFLSCWTSDEGLSVSKSNMTCLATRWEVSHVIVLAGTADSSKGQLA